MKPFFFIAALLFFKITTAGNPFLLYLHAAPPVKKQLTPNSYLPLYTIPHYQIPKGAVFCRMEDKLTKATGLWIKIGVK
jgi:hypothetical protein